MSLLRKEADGGEVGAGEGGWDGSRDGCDHEVEDGEVREVAEGVRDGPVQARHVHDAQGLQLVELADGRRERGRDVVAGEEDLDHAALVVAERRRGASRAAGPPARQHGWVAELLPDLDQRREVSVGLRLSE